MADKGSGVDAGDRGGKHLEVQLLVPTSQLSTVAIPC